MAPDKKEFPALPSTTREPEVLTDLVIYQRVRMIDLDGRRDPNQSFRDAHRLERLYGDAVLTVVFPGGVTINALPESLVDAEILAEGERIEKELQAIREKNIPDSSRPPE